MNQQQRRRQQELSKRYRNENAARNLSDTGRFGDETDGAGEGSLYYDTKFPQQIYQENAKDTSTYTEHPVVNWTDSKESYQRIAKRERNILRWNNRTPMTEIRLHLRERSFEEINAPLAKILRTLQRDTKKRKGLQYVAVVEVTTRRGKPINRVHFHFLTDDERSEEELKQFFIMACERAGLVANKDFHIRTRKLWNGKKYFDYVLKYKKWKDKVILFKKVRRAKLGERKKGKRTATRLQKTFQSRWFRKPKKQIRKDIQEFKKARDAAKAKGLDTSGMFFGLPPYPSLLTQSGLGEGK